VEDLRDEVERVVRVGVGVDVLDDEPRHAACWIQTAEVYGRAEAEEAKPSAEPGIEETKQEKQAEQTKE